MGGRLDRIRYIVVRAKRKLDGELGVTDADIYNIVWKEYQRLVGKQTEPNFWVILISPEDGKSLGGPTEVARICAEKVHEIVRNEGVGWGHYTVVCRTTIKLSAGTISLKAKCLPSETLHEEIVKAYHLGDGVYSSKNMGMSGGESQPVAEYSLECLWNGELYPLTGDTGVGRVLDNDIVIEDPVVSAYHARLESFKTSPTGWVFRDLKSTCGSRVNHEPVSGTTSLKEDDVITLADRYTLVLRRSNV